MRRAMDELVFESFEFAACATVPSQRLAASAVSRPVCLVLDSGFSFTTAVPIVDGVELPYCARRLSIGGKALTNFLKETVSFRSWNMMDETAVINAVKERLCYVSMAYFDELASTRLSNDIVKQYVLPDLSRGKTDPMGHVLTDTEERDGTEQLLAMNNERIAIPEILFNPSDVGLSQAGIPEVIFQAVEACPIKVRAEMYANIILTGGNCKFPNFKRRVEEELRPLVDTAYEVNVFIDEQPVLTAFKGAVRAVTGHSIPLKFVTKAMYEEHGTDNLLRMLYATQ